MNQAQMRFFDAAMRLEFPREFTEYWLDVYFDIWHEDDMSVDGFIELLREKRNAGKGE